MDLLFSEEQMMLRDTTRRLCEQVVPLTVLRTLEGTDPGYSVKFWQSLGELGIPGIAVPAAAGGLGLGSLETMIVHEEFGRGLALCPHFISSLLAASLIERAGTEPQRRRWLPDIANGAAIVTVASLEADGGYCLEAVRCRATRTSEGYRLSGTKYFVPYASGADAVIVLARSGDAPEEVIGLIVELSSSGLTMRYQPNHAREPQFRLDFADVHVPAENVLKRGGSIAADWWEAMYGALIPLAAQAVGGAARVHEITVEYAKVREAFGKPIGGFQSIAHYLADVAVEIEGCRTLVQQAAWARDNGRPFRRLAAIAKLQSDEMYRRAAAVAIQVHGGLGYTNDADPQLFFRRAKQLQLLNWSADFLEERIAELVLQETADV